MANNSRILSQVINLNFIEAKNLTFNTDSRWEFSIKYSSENELSIDQIYYVSILYKGEPNLAVCQAINSTFLLNYILNKEGQSRYDLIQINHEVTNGATIKWNNLFKPYEIPIEATLYYVDSYDMTYHYFAPNTRYWDFRVKVGEKVLPENSIVNIDLFYSSTVQIVAKCKHINYFLYCEFNYTKASNYLISISPEKYLGSIEWENLENNVTVPLTFIPRYFNQPYNLELINNQWTYIIESQSSLGVGSDSAVITLNTKIVDKNNNQYIYFTKCTGISSVKFECIVFGDNQDILDMVYVSNSMINDVSSNLTSQVKTDQLVARKAELSFVKVYDLEYNKGWIFKILVDNDQNLPQNCIVYVDIQNNRYSTCTFENHILTCNKLSISISSTDLVRFQSQKYKGSVTWNNLKQKYISIPLKYQLQLKNAYNAFFTDKWNFIISVVYKGNAPKLSKVVIDIKQNSIETTASCELTRQGSSSLNYYIICVSELEEQSINDIITISSTKKDGSVTWTNEINESNNKVEKVSLEDSNFKSILLDFRDAYGMYYSNNKWFFSIYAYNSSNYAYDSNLGMYKVDISVIRSSTEFKAIAFCLLYDGISTPINRRLLCSCEYEDQRKDDLIKISYTKSSSSTITWKGGITADFPIVLNTILTIKKADILQKNVDGYWIFDIETENNENTILPLNSKVVVDVDKDDNTNKYANCTVNYYNKLSCVSDVVGIVEPKLKYLKTLDSSVIWTNENLEDYYILTNANIGLISLDNLYYIDGKWHFTLKVTSLYSAKIIIDILYNNNPSTATCYGGKNYIVNCTVDNENQSKTALIKLTKEKSSLSTITWTNVNEDKDIPLWIELTFDKANNLHNDTEYKKWIFDIYIKDNDIPEEAYTIVDIQFLYYYGTDERYIKRMNSYADCYHSNKKLTCTAYIDRTNDNLYYYSTSLVKTKNPDSISTVIQWKDMPSDTLSITLSAYLKYYSATKLFKENNKNIFYIELYSTTKVPKSSPCIIDIIIGDENKQSNCIVHNHTFLRCEIDDNDDITNKKVYISKDKSAISSITWINVKENQCLFPIKLSFIGAYNLIAGGTFKLLATGNELKNGLIIPVKIFRIKNAEINIFSNVSCEFNNDYFFCYWKDYGDRCFLKLEKEGDTIEWINPGNYTITTGTKTIKYGQLIYCYYNETNNYYQYSIKISLINTYDSNTNYVMDILIKDTETYGICLYNESSKNLECFTSKKTRNNDDTITIKYTRKNGNVDWRIITGNEEIYPKNNLFADISKIYDLQYNTDKWEFKIKYNYITNFEGTKEIDIKLGNEEKTATCQVINASDKILNCVSPTLAQPELIEINYKYISNEHLRLYELKQEGIPLVATLDFKSASNLKYDNGWSFLMKANIQEGASILEGSTFSIDIKYDNDNDELAFCTEKGRENNELTLLCVPQHELSRGSLITLSNGAKSEYSSITWNSPISDEDTIILMDLELDVEYVTIPEYDTNTNKWKFQMIFFDDDILPLNSKIKIDIKYNDEEALATCNLIEQNKFECSPDVSPQNKNDKFIILSTKNKGTVTFMNSPELLQFTITLYYLNTNNFKMEDKCTFDIKLSLTNLKEGNYVNIDVLLDENRIKSNCKFELDSLKCEFDYDKDNKPKLIKIINDKTNDEFNWVNIPDEVELYREIIIIETTYVPEEIKETEKTTEIIIDKKIYGYYYNTEEKVFIIEEDDSIKTDDKILEEIRKKLNNGEINSSYLINGHYFIVEYKNIRYIISTLEEQDDNLPSINFGECPNKLRESKNLPENTLLYILYIEVTEEGMNIPKVEYEIYSLSQEQKYEKFNLEVCKEIKVEKVVFVNISESDLYLYNSSSDFYNDVCYTYTSNRGTDISLKDRRDEYINNNMTLCEDGCDLSSYDSSTGKAYCSCSISTSISSISDIKIDTSKLKSNFLNIKNIANFEILKCYARLFSNKIGNNVGFFVVTIVIIFGMASSFIFYYYSYAAFKNQIQSIYETKKLEMNEKEEKEEKDNDSKIKEDTKRGIKNIKFEKSFPPKKSVGDNKSGEDNSNKHLESQHNDENELHIEVHNISKTSDKFDNDQITKEENKSKKVMDYNDSELNLLSYKEALEIDKRTYLQYYLSLLRTKHLLIFTFYTTKDYNSRIIKINLFLFTFILNYTVNGFFFDDSTMHKIYEDGGGFDLNYHIPQIVYSTIISSVIITLVKLTALTESNVIKIRSAKLKDLNEVYKSEVKSIYRKFICFFIIIFILLLFFWYYIGCFCAVYKNTQTHHIKNTITSFAASLIYPFIYNLLPSIIRIIALKEESKKRKHLYKFSIILQMF